MHWQDKPYRIDVKKGEKKAFCQCGKTKTPPFCDGAHKGLAVEPKRITFEEDAKVSICMCGLSKKMPFCDGAHRCKQD